jgi:ATP-dependent DNA helicase RecQ
MAASHLTHPSPLGRSDEPPGAPAAPAEEAAEDQASAADELLPALQQLGYTSFRAGQRTAIETLLERRRLLLVAPTGGGKSLCYQLPALLLSGTTLVISPLVALMHDQVAALEARGVAATFLASTLPSQEIKERMARLRQGAYKLIYVAPERLVYDGFRALMQQLEVPLIAVDEAHCISEWGHDFRPEYMKIGDWVREVAHTRVLACTATATPVVRDEILNRLGLPDDTPQIVQGFARPNLALAVQDVSGARARQPLTDDLLHRALGSPKAPKGTAIVYAPTRKSTEEEAQRLQARGWRAQAYHAGLPGELRGQVLTDFMQDKVSVVVATNAFGMGIDRSDVRAVVHLAPPGSIEAYYQEVGRAGRDGAPAWGLMLTSARDLPQRRSLLDRPAQDGSVPPAAAIEHKWNLFLELMRWSEGGSCRHDAILRYFGDEVETLAGCGQCDVCVALADGTAEADPEQVALLVRKGLSGIARVHGRFGLQAAVLLLRGEADPRLERRGLHQTKTFGILKEHSKAWVLALLRRCVTAGWVDLMRGDLPLAVLTERGQAVMQAKLPVRLMLPKEAPPKGAVDARSRRAGGYAAADGASRGRRGTAPPAKDDILDAASQEVFDALRKHRLSVARRDSVAPYVIASDRTLRDLARLRPRNIQEMGLAHGIGPAKVERYGQAFLQVIAAAR